MGLGIVNDEVFDKVKENLKPVGTVQERKTPTPASSQDVVEESHDELFPTVSPADILITDNDYVNKVLGGEIIIPLNRGRNGAKATPEILQKIIGEEYAISGREEGLKLAESFELSPSSASAYANSATSTSSYNKPKDALDDFIKGRKARIIKKASAKVLAAIEGIDEAKLAEAPAGVLAGIARNLSGVIKDLEPPVKSDEKVSNVQFIMYAPRLIPEASLEVIQVNE